MHAHAQTRWIRGAIEGSERLCLSLPWMRGTRPRRTAPGAERPEPPAPARPTTARAD